MPYIHSEAGYLVVSSKHLISLSMCVSPLAKFRVPKFHSEENNGCDCGPVWKVWLFLTRSRVCIQKIQVYSVQNRVKCTQVCMFIRQVARINDKLKLNFNMYNQCILQIKISHSFTEYPNHKILNFRLFLCILQTSSSLSHSLHTLRFQRKNRNQVCKPERNKNSRVCICHTFHTGLWSLVNIRKISTFFCEVFKVSFPCHVSEFRFRFCARN